uniref:Gliding motility protein SprA N-terminal domain-containing protein n=1 Tax=Stylophora pistillata TaxID=50429 RepID=A0A2B4S086_STYPI
MRGGDASFIPSKFSLRGDVAYLAPDNSDAVNLAGEPTAYIDDFEDAQRPIEISGARPWKLASKPLNFKDKNGVQYDFGPDVPNNLDYGKQRAKLAWYNIDRIFYQKTAATPKNIDDEELSRNEVSAITYSELFPKKELDVTQLDLLNTLDLAYYPRERGSYNYDTNTDAEGRLNTPEKRWAGITRPIFTNDFQRNNIEYIQFWMQDPYENYAIKKREGANENTPIKEGKLFLNLGNISEDILRDDLKQYENGLPEATDPVSNVKSVWGDYPTKSKFMYAFDDSEENRRVQDVGLDGLSDAAEKIRFPALKNLEDPSSDNYEFYRGSRHDNANSTILERYKNYNNTEGNARFGSLNTENYPTMGSNVPDAEDINNDQTMNTINAYYQYEISLNENDLVLGKNYIVDTKTTTRQTPLGDKQIKWYQFRIPIKNGRSIGGISNFNAIRFMRFFLTRFKSPVVLRLAKIELVQGSWIRALRNIHENTPENKDVLDDVAQSNFKIGVVNIEENENRTPIPYVMPPDIQREQMRGSGTSIQKQNEQSLSLAVKNLPAGETRGVYKNVSQDLRMYEKLKIFVHSEAVGNDDLKDDDLVAVLRMGSDLDAHYYQVELPLKKTDWGAKTATEIWRNEFQIDLKKLARLKIDRYKVRGGKNSHLIFPAVKEGEKPMYRMRVKGFPNLANIKTILLGVKNADPSGANHSGEVWFNEMRVAGFEKKGGWATQLDANMNLSDLANVSVNGRYETIGFGDVNQRTDERNQDEIKQYGLITNINAGKILPKKWGINLPLNYTLTEGRGWVSSTVGIVVWAVEKIS